MTSAGAEVMALQPGIALKDRGEIMTESIKCWVMALAVVVLPLFGCALPSQTGLASKTIPPDENLLRVGVSTKAPPLIFKHRDKIVGLEADLARELSAYLGKSLQFVELKWNDQIPALLDNRIDIIMSGMTVTNPRKMRVAFSNPYFKSGQMGMVRNTDALVFYQIINGRIVGYVKRTTGEYFVERQMINAQKVGFSDSEAGVKALIDKKIDALIHDGPIILYLASKYESKGVMPVFNLLTTEYLAWGIRIADADLLESVNTFLENLKSSGRLEEIVRQWIPLVRMVK
jgi:polar amino acid transport system substrate-binding protein